MTTRCDHDSGPLHTGADATVGVPSREALRHVSGVLLDVRRPSHSLRPEVVEFARILAVSTPIPSGSSADIASGETRTAHGLALSPTMAAMCTDDYVRTIEFIRGTHAAIKDAQRRVVGRPIRILYVGCGPRATLAVPLMAVFAPAEATFTLLDLHAESIQSTRNVIDALGLASSVAGMEIVDATRHCIPTDQKPDIILVETMRACLEAEPQVAITRHLLNQAPDAVLIPEEVRVDLVLVDVAREFDLDSEATSRTTKPSGSAPLKPVTGQDSSLATNRSSDMLSALGDAEGQKPVTDRCSHPVQRDRILLGTVFTLNRDTARSWEHETGVRLPGATVQMPAVVDARYQPLLFTVIRVYGEHWLKDYDSGLNGPRTPVINESIRPGDTVEFSYELGSHPRLQGNVAARSGI